MIPILLAATLSSAIRAHMTFLADDMLFPAQWDPKLGIHVT